MDKEAVIIVITGILSITGFFGAFAITRLAKSMDSLVASDSSLQAQLASHREDVVRNYVRHDRLDAHRAEHRLDVAEIKQDVMQRMDKLEESVKEALQSQSKHLSFLMTQNTKHKEG